MTKSLKTLLEYLDFSYLVENDQLVFSGPMASEKLNIPIYSSGKQNVLSATEYFTSDNVFQRQINFVQWAVLPDS